MIYSQPCSKSFQTKRIQIFYLFRKTFKFNDFMDNNIFRKNHKGVHRIVKFEYFAKVITYLKSPDHFQNFIEHVHILTA